MMPLLFSLGQHSALEAIQRRLFVFLDDIYVVSNPGRVGPIYQVLEVELRRRAGIHIHTGKTQVWNAAGVRPAACDELERVARATIPSAQVWKGLELHASARGIKVLGTPLGHPEFVHARLEALTEKHQVLLERIPKIADVQSAWALLLHCANARSNYYLRVVRPAFARAHDEGLWTCLSAIMGVPSTLCSETAREVASLPLAMGGMGLRSAVRTASSAFWASWADCLHMIHLRHPAVAKQIVRGLEGQSNSASLKGQPPTQVCSCPRFQEGSCLHGLVLRVDQQR